jgi:hypothetical protein
VTLPRVAAISRLMRLDILKSNIKYQKDTRMALGAWGIGAA